MHLFITLDVFYLTQFYRCKTTNTQKRAFNSSKLRNGTDLGAAPFPEKSRAFWGGRILPLPRTFMTHWAFVLLKVNGESVVPDPENSYESDRIGGSMFRKHRIQKNGTNFYQVELKCYGYRYRYTAAAVLQPNDPVLTKSGFLSGGDWISRSKRITFW